MRMIMTLDGEVDQELMAVAQQIVSKSPNGRYAEYARLYLANAELRVFFADSDRREGLPPPDFGGVAATFAAMSPSIPLVRAAWHYYAGYTCCMSRDVGAARMHLEALLGEWPLSPWASRAAELLADLDGL